MTSTITIQDGFSYLQTKKLISPDFQKQGLDTVILDQVNKVNSEKKKKKKIQIVRALRSKKKNDWTLETKKIRKKLCYYFYTQGFVKSKITDVYYIKFYKKKRILINTPGSLINYIKRIDHLKKAIQITQSQQCIKQFLSKQKKKCEKKIGQLWPKYKFQLVRYVQLMRKFIVDHLQKVYNKFQKNEKGPADIEMINEQDCQKSSSQPSMKDWSEIEEQFFKKKAHRQFGEESYQES